MHFLAVALSFPVVVYTVLLGVACVYWVFVMIGAAHVNLLGDGALDGAVDGALDGAVDGATKGVLEGAAEHLDHGGDVGEGGNSAGVLAALKLRSAPATIVLSFLILFSWIFAVAGVKLLEGFGVSGALASLLHVALLLFAPILALLPTSIAVRPLARVFAPPASTTHAALVGKTCTIRTGTVTHRFGEAMLEDGGAGVVVRVRVENEEKLARGDQAVIVGYDPDRQEFTVAPLELEDEPRLKRTR